MTVSTQSTPHPRAKITPRRPGPLAWVGAFKLRAWVGAPRLGPGPGPLLAWLVKRSKGPNVRSKLPVVHLVR